MAASLAVLLALPACDAGRASFPPPPTRAEDTALRPATQSIAGGAALAAELLEWSATYPARPHGAVPPMQLPGRTAMAALHHAADDVETSAMAAGDGLDPTGSSRNRRLAGGPTAAPDRDGSGDNLDEVLSDEWGALAALAGASTELAGRAFSLCAPLEADNRLLDGAGVDRSRPSSLRTAVPATATYRLEDVGGALLARVRTALALVVERRGEHVGATPRAGLLGLVALQQALALDETLLAELLVDARAGFRPLTDPDGYDPVAELRWLPASFGALPDTAHPRSAAAWRTVDASSDLAGLVTVLLGAAELGWIADPDNPIAALRELFETPPLNGNGGGGDGELVTWEDDIRPLLQGAAGCLGCHAAPQPSSGFRVDRYADVLGLDPNSLPQSGLRPVVPGNRAASPLWLVLQGPWRDPAGRTVPRMPRGRPALSASDLELVGTWIDQGAPERRRATGPGPRPGLTLARVALRTLVALHQESDGAYAGLLHARSDGTGAGIVDSRATGLALHALATLLAVAPDEPGLRDALMRAADAAVVHLTDANGGVLDELDLHAPAVVPPAGTLDDQAAMTSGLLAAGRVLQRADLVTRGRACGERLLLAYRDVDTGRFVSHLDGTASRRWSAASVASTLTALRELAVAGVPAGATAAGDAIAGWLPVFAASELDGDGEVLDDGIADTDGDGIAEPAAVGRAPRLRSSALEGPRAPADPTAPIAWSTQLVPLLRTKCDGCHVAGADRGGYRLDTPALAALAGESGRSDLIVAGAASRSLLWRKLVERRPPVGQQMPLARPPLDPTAVELVRRWIDEGARNR
ncbi:MAG: hypothetical protein IPM29_29145 [Planctomycetes bacterium]|nr:hypothetical protein [Planctomycetota bacterium]